jgi:hypothetical protein
VLQAEVSPRQGCEEIDLNVREQVIALALEYLVRPLVDDNDNVPSDGTWHLIGCLLKGDRLPIPHPLVDVYLEQFALAGDLLAATRLAAVLGVDDLAFPITLVTRLLDLLQHRAQLSEDDFDTSSLASTTLSHSAGFSALSVALCADDGLVKREFGRLSLVQVFEGYGNAMDEIFALLRTLRTSRPAATEETTTATTTKELREEVFWVHAAHTTLIRKTGFA